MLPVCLSALFALSAPFTLPPGRYLGVGAAGQVHLELLPDGSARFGGATFKWTRTENGLRLAPPAGTALELAVEEAEAGVWLVGPSFGRLRLRPAPIPAVQPLPPPERPADWTGVWRHAAPGGGLVLRLDPAGDYTMTQTVGGGAPQVTRGRWQADEGALVLTPEGGEALRYRARREGPTLLIGGGDLPFEVRFGPADGG